jgi:hypothetical protein
LTLEEKLMLEVLRLKQENQELRAKLKENESDCRSSILTGISSGEKEIDVQKQDWSDSDDEDDLEGNFIPHLDQSKVHKKKDNGFESPEVASFHKKEAKASLKAHKS